MFTRSRQSQNYSGTPQRNQAAPQNQGQYQGQQNYNQGNYQGGNQNQQYKQQGGNTPYKQQAQQQQNPQNQQGRNMQQNQQPAQQQQQVKQQQQSPQQPQTPQTAQRLKPILKSSSNNTQSNTAQPPIQNQNFVPAQQQQQQQQEQQPLKNEEKESQQQSNNGMENSDPPESMDSEVSQDVPKWKLRKGPNFKVNKKLKRLRLNQRLRKTLQPKNAIMVLNEMKTGVHFTFPEQQSSVPNALFLVHAEIDGKTFIGQGVSKPLARQNAAENALKSLLLEKMTAAAMKARVDAENEGSTANITAATEESESKDASESNISESIPEDPNEIPWSSLASFALYKLFLEWQNQGTVVPVPRPGVSPGKQKKEAVKFVVPKELPPNPTVVHPVMLLNQMRPGLIYTEISRVGNPPNITFTLAVEIDGQDYIGTAKNKKDAKKLAAKAALQALYNLTYPEEIQSSEDVNMS